MSCPCMDRPVSKVSIPAPEGEVYLISTLPPCSYCGVGVSVDIRMVDQYDPEVEEAKAIPLYDGTGSIPVLEEGFLWESIGEHQPPLEGSLERAMRLTVGKEKIPKK